MSNIMAIIFLFLSIGIILDFIFLTFWKPFYFRIGLPLYRFHFLIHRRSYFWERIPNLEGNPIQHSLFSTTVFKRMGESELAFKSNLLDFNIIPTFYHGIVRFHPQSGVVTVRGFLSWVHPLFYIWALFFFEQFVSNSNLFNHFNVIILLALFFILIVAAQIYVLQQVGKYIHKFLSPASQ